MKKLILSLILILCVVLMVACDGCSKYNENYKYDGSSLIGKWMDEAPNENEYDVYEFIDSDTVILTKYCFGIALDSLEGKYYVEEDNKIVIESAFGFEYIRFSIYEENGEKRLVLLVLDDLNNPSEGERIMKPYSLTYNEGVNALVGTWKSTDNPNEKFIFNEDFKGKSVGLASSGEVVEYNIRYSFNAGKVYIIIDYMIGYEEQVAASNYEIKNGILTLTGENKTDGSAIVLTFERE